MIRFRIVLVATLMLLFAAFAWSQAEPRDDAKPQQEEVKPQEEKPKDEKAQEQVKPNEKDNKKASEEAKPAHADQEGKTAAAQSGEQAHPAGKSARIPDDKFKAHFGRQHTFVATSVVRTTTVVAGQTNFVYGGYTFVILQPWPVGWVMTDQCYIDYINGEYFLIDVVQPQFQVSLSVVL